MGSSQFTPVVSKLLYKVLTDEIRKFILQNTNTDVRTLALRYADKSLDFDLKFALQQIRGRQAARHKLPMLYKRDDIIYPPGLSMEQCSSETTALYKAKLSNDCELLLDLTGGFGIDFMYMAQGKKHAIYVEKNIELYNIAKHNFSTLNLDVEVYNEDGISYFYALAQKHDLSQTLLYIDPARRDDGGNKIVSIKDCKPNILPHIKHFVQACKRVTIKLSPMLNYNEAVAQIEAQGVSVCKIHVVAVANECKELLLILSKDIIGDNPLQIHCINDDKSFSYSFTENTKFSLPLYDEEVSEKTYIYLPYSPVMKMHAFSVFAHRYDLKALSHNSHIYISNELKKETFARILKVKNISTFNKRELTQALKTIKQANIITRNSHFTPDELRKRLHIKDGGETYIIATRNAEDKDILYICEKV